MQFFDAIAWPLHCGIEVSADPSKERQVKPTRDEKEDGVEEIGITLGLCRAVKQRLVHGHWERSECGEKIVFVRHKYPGGWGPVHRVRDKTKAAAYKRRYDLAPPSDIVMGWNHKWGYQTKMAVQ